MALTSCQECGNQISEEAKACPKCGFRPTWTKWWLRVPLAGIALFLLLGALVGNTPEGREKARAAIDLCWSEEKRKPLDPQSQRFVASTCEMMEREFTEKYHLSP